MRSSYMVKPLTFHPTAIEGGRLKTLLAHGGALAVAAVAVRT